MTIVTVGLGTRGYDVTIEAGLLARAGELLAPRVGARAVTIVADANAAPHLATLTGSLRRAGVESHTIEIAPGEASKSWASLEALCDALLAWMSLCHDRDN